MSCDLAVLSDVKAYMGITTTSDNTLLDMLIDQASNIIKNELGTDVCATTYTNEVYSGDGTNTLMLDNYPIIEIISANDDKQDAMYIKNTNATNTHATVQVTSDKVVLRKTAAGVQTTNNIMRSDYATLTLMNDAVTAVTDWSGTITAAYSAYPVSELLQMPGKNAQNNTAVHLYVPDLTEGDYEIQNVNRAVLYNPYYWSSGYNNVFVTYRAGWETIPDAIQSVCQQLVKLLYDQRSISAGYKKEKIGDYEYELQDSMNISTKGTISLQSLSPTLYLKIMPYKRLLVG